MLRDKRTIEDVIDDVVDGIAEDVVDDIINDVIIVYLDLIKDNQNRRYADPKERLRKIMLSQYFMRARGVWRDENKRKAWIRSTEEVIKNGISVDTVNFLEK